MLPVPGAGQLMCRWPAVQQPSNSAPIAGGGKINLEPDNKHSSVVLDKALLWEQAPIFNTHS